MGYYRSNVSAGEIKKPGTGYYTRAIDIVENVSVHDCYLSHPGVKAEAENNQLAGSRLMKFWFVAGVVVLTVAVAVFLYQHVVSGSYEMGLSQQVQIEQQVMSGKQEENRIARLMVGGERAFSNANYIMPEDKSAYAYYQQVLKLQADHLAAQDGLKNIEKELLGLARFAYFGKQYKKSLNYLDQIRVVNPDSSAAKTLYSKVESEQEESAQISAWLAEAENYMKDSYLTELSDNNAYEIYKKILTHQPDNTRALRGVESVKQHYFKKHISTTQLNREESDMRVMKKTHVPESVTDVKKTREKFSLAKIRTQTKKSVKNKVVSRRQKYKALSIEQASQRISQFKIALQTGNKRGLKRMSRYIPGREKFVDGLFGQYKKINVKISDFKLIASENKARVKVTLNDLIDINNKKVIPGNWSQFEITW